MHPTSPYESGRPPGPPTVPEEEGTPGHALYTISPPPPSPPPTGKTGSAGRRLLVVALSMVGGLAILGGGGIAVNMVANAQQTVTNRAEFGPVMWRNVPAEKLFPKTLGGKASPVDSAADPKQGGWRRMGIAQRTGCREGLNGKLAAAVARQCRAVVRATYVDSTSNVVATVALVILPHISKTDERLWRQFQDEKHGVRAYGVSNTVAAGWRDERRIGSDGKLATGSELPYGVAATAGSLDGRMAGDLPERWDIGRFSDARPWRGAAEDLATAEDLHLSDLMYEETR